jgi:hypothetical protein
VHVHRIGAGAIVDAHGLAMDRYRATASAAVLVRPDGYVAATVDLSSAGVIVDHFAGVGS